MNVLYNITFSSGHIGDWGDFVYDKQYVMLRRSISRLYVLGLMLLAFFIGPVSDEWYFLDLQCTNNGFLVPKNNSEVVSEGVDIFLCVSHECFSG